MKTIGTVILLMMTLVSADPKCAKVVIMTCNWALGRYQVAKQFIQEDIPNFGDKVTINLNAGGRPRFSCQNESGEQIEMVDFADFNRFQMRETLIQWEVLPLLELPLLSEEL